MRSAFRLLCLLFGLFGLAALANPATAHADDWPKTVIVPSGTFLHGSDRAEREAAYKLDQAAYGHSITRQNEWYETEKSRTSTMIPTFRIMQTPVTNQLYARFVAATGHRVPDVDEATWKSYGLVHPFSRTRQFAWKDGAPPAGRENHPVVLVSIEDARTFAEWLSKETGVTWSLPDQLQWEKAARGQDGRRFPWGNEFDPSLLNSHDKGPFTTLPVGHFPEGASPYGMLDAAGQVFEWTETPAGKGRSIVKGGSWDDKGCGVCRPAAGHSRPDTIKHILIGFRLVQD